MLNKKFDANSLNDTNHLKFFVKNGFVIYKNVFEKKIFNLVRKNILNSYNNLVVNFKKKK